MCSFHNESIWCPLPGIIVQNHLIQGKEAAVMFKISILDVPYKSLKLNSGMPLNGRRMGNWDLFPNKGRQKFKQSRCPGWKLRNNVIRRNALLEQTMDFLKHKMSTLEHKHILIINVTWKRKRKYKIVSCNHVVLDGNRRYYLEMMLQD